MVSGNETLPAAEDSSEFMTSVYSFRGLNEFTKLPTMNQKTFETTVQTFRDSLSQHTYSEYPIELFSKWYEDINKFGAVLKQCNYLENETSGVSWDYRLIVLNPAGTPDEKKTKKMDWAQELAINFLHSVFNSNIDDRQSIGSAVLLEFTVMIVACRRSYEGIQPKRLYSIHKEKKKPWLWRLHVFGMERDLRSV